MKRNFTMDEHSQEMYLQNLEEFVLDEDKIVTYKWLSKSLNIHVNQSKQLLYTFCSNKDKQASVSATYLLAGRIGSTGAYCIRVVGQDKYEETKSSFESLSSEHVFSVEKKTQTPSEGTLFTANSEPIEEKAGSTSSLGAIKCMASVRRAAEELERLRITVAPAPALKPAAVSKQAQASTSKESEKVSPVKSKSDEKNGKDPAGNDAKGKGGLAAMFAAQTSKVSGKVAAASKTNAKGNKSGGISNFFSKVSKEEHAENEAAKAAKEKDKCSEKIKQEAAKEKNKSSEKIKQEETIDTSDEGSSPIENNEKKKKTDSNAKKEATSKTAKQTKQKKTRSNKKEAPKKRARIVEQLSDSSDEDMFADFAPREPSPVPDVEAIALESDDEEDVKPSTSVAPGSNGRIRRKRKVTKDETFMDDGYMVTRKVTVYESFSESDSENSEAKKVKEEPKAEALNSSTESASSIKSKIKKSKPSGKKASPVTNKSPLKSKQQTLKNFFKKKD